MKKYITQTGIELIYIKGEGLGSLTQGAGFPLENIYFNDNPEIKKPLEEWLKEQSIYDF